MNKLSLSLLMIIGASGNEAQSMGYIFGKALDKVFGMNGALTRASYTAEELQQRQQNPTNADNVIAYFTGNNMPNGQQSTYSNAIAAVGPIVPMFTAPVVIPVTAVAIRRIANDRINRPVNIFEQIRKKNYSSVIAALEAGSDIDQIDANGNTLLGFACYEGNLQIVKVLIEKGANINATDREYRFTPLHHAITRADSPDLALPIVIYLINKGANINAPDSEGRTPIYHAASLNRKDTVLKLIQSNADISLMDYHGERPIDIQWLRSDVKSLLLVGHQTRSPLSFHQFPTVPVKTTSIPVVANNAAPIQGNNNNPVNHFAGITSFLAR